MKDFKGKTAVVTGAASGIGLALSKAFASRSMNLVMADVEEDALNAAAEDIAANGTQVLARVTNVRQPQQLADLADQTWERFGGCHILCNNAGVGAGGPITELTLDDWSWVLEVNLLGVIYGIHSFLNRMLEQDQDCHIVNTASVAGLVSTPGMGPYNASKQAVVAISETLAAETAATPLSVSVLCPAWVNTNIATSERNAPNEMDISKLSGDALEMQNQVAEFLLKGMSPSAVADHVVDAIEKERLYILTHADFMPLIEQRFAGILDHAPKAV